MTSASCVGSSASCVGRWKDAGTKNWILRWAGTRYIYLQAKLPQRGGGGGGMEMGRNGLGHIWNTRLQPYLLSFDDWVALVLCTWSAQGLLHCSWSYGSLAFIVVIIVVVVMCKRGHLA